MKVRDLIAALQTFDPELPVLIPSPHQLEFCVPSEVFADVAAQAGATGALHLCDYEDEGAATYVRLGVPSDVEERDERPKPRFS